MIGELTIILEFSDDVRIGIEVYCIIDKRIFLKEDIHADKIRLFQT